MARRKYKRREVAVGAVSAAAITQATKALGALAVGFRRETTRIGSTNSPLSLPVVDVRDWAGLDLSGSNDNSTILREAANGVPDDGGILLLPAGTLAVSGSVPIKPNTWVHGVGVKTIIVPMRIADGFEGFRALHSAAPKTEYAVFVNSGYAIPAKREEGFTFSDFVIGPISGQVTFDYKGFQSKTWNGHLIRIHRANKIRIERVIFRNAADGTAFTDSSDTIVRRCSALNMSNVAFDHWFGGGHHVVQDCHIQSCQWGVLVTGEGTYGEDAVQRHVRIENVRVVGAGQAAIMANCLSPRSSVTDFQVTNCQIDGAGVVVDDRHRIYGCGIVGHGDIRNALVRQNTLKNMNGNPIQFQEESYDSYGIESRPPSGCVIVGNRLIDCTPIRRDGSPGSLIVLRGPHHRVTDNQSIRGTYDFAVDASYEATAVSGNRMSPGQKGLYKLQGNVISQEQEK